MLCDVRSECSSSAGIIPFTVNSIAAIRCETLHKTDLRITNHRGHKVPPSLRLLLFKTRIEYGLQCWAQLHVFRAYCFYLLQYSRQRRPNFSAYTVALMTKNDLTFPAFSEKRCPHSAFTERRSSLTMAWFSWTNHDSLLRTATNEIASFCVDNRLRQIVNFFFCLPEWAKGGFPVTVERYWFRTERFYCISLLLSYIQVDSMLTCACSIIDRRWHQNVVRKSETHSAVTSCATFLFLPRLGRHLWSIKQLDFYQVTVDESAGRANWPSTEIKNE